MSEVIKLSDSENSSIQKSQQRIAEITIGIGKTALALHEAENDVKRLKELYENLLKDFDSAIIAENELSDSLSKIYGPGFVDVTSGTFIKQTLNNRQLNETVVTK